MSYETAFKVPFLSNTAGWVLSLGGTPIFQDIKIKHSFIA
jgi:hypothetical protein